MAALEEVLRRPPREGLGCLVNEDEPYRPAAQPRRGPQAGKSGDPRS